MKVFVSWSGIQSRRIAEALHWWLPRVIQSLEPWMSDADVDKGTRWSAEISKELEQSNFGIICLTPENLNEPWLLFEAGALSKKDDAHVCTYLWGLEPAEVQQPLGQFQATKCDKSDTKHLIENMNKNLLNPLKAGQLESTCEVWWPELQKRLADLPAAIPSARQPRGVESMVEEVLSTVREQTKNITELRDLLSLTLPGPLTRLPDILQRDLITTNLPKAQAEDQSYRRATEILSNPLPEPPSSERGRAGPRKTGA